MKILNLYANIGGNRRLWGNEHEITAVEIDPKKANIYKHFFPNDEIITTDAHLFLLENYTKYDFIWSSIPCKSHSRMNYYLNKKENKKYPDMKLYEEIIFLTHFAKSKKWVVENVQGYYEPLIQPQISGRHFFWANFKIPKMEHRLKINLLNGSGQFINKKEVRHKVIEMYGFNFDNIKYSNKERLLRDCLDPEIGKAILDSAMGIIKQNSYGMNDLFNQNL